MVKTSTKDLFSKDERKDIFYFPYSNNNSSEKQNIAHPLMREKRFLGLRSSQPALPSHRNG